MTAMALCDRQRDNTGRDNTGRTGAQMYQPPHFREDDLTAQHALIRAFPLGLLITAGTDGPVANLVPFQLVAVDPGKGMLRCHLARANGQLRELAEGGPALVVFQGPDAYVTPSWYETKRETGKVVPTWNYATVQVRGVARVVDDAEWLLGHVGALTDGHEMEREEPWAVGDAPEAYIKAQLKGIVGVEIAVTGIEGKWKVSQNRSAADIDGVANGLAESAGRPGSAGMADMVRRYAPAAK